MNYRFQDDDVVTIPAPSGGVVSGQFVVIGALHGFALDSAPEGSPFALVREGRVLDAPKGNVAVTAGDPLYYDATNHCFTNVPPPDSDPVAVAVSDAAQAAATVDLVLVPVSDGGDGGYEPDGTSIDLDPQDRLRVKADGHSQSMSTVTGLQAALAGKSDTGHGHATLPSEDEKDALAGTSGTPSGTNKYVTDSDPRLSGGEPGLLAVFTGRDGAGPCSVPGAEVGMHVAFVLNLTDSTDDTSKFEEMITVQDQIQQTDEGDLSAKKFFLIAR